MAYASSGDIELRFDHASVDQLNDTFGIRIGTTFVPKAKLADKLTNDKLNHPDEKHVNKCYHGPIFIPFGRFIMYWNGFLFCILIWSVIEIPYSIAFGIDIGPDQAIPIIGAFIDFCLIIDIVIAFRTAYIDKFDRLRIIHDPVLIAKRYLKSWFIVDLLSCLPLSYLIYIFTDKASIWHSDLQYFRLLRILKLLRIFKIINTFQFFREHGIQKNVARGERMFVASLKHICLMVFMAHYFACFWYGIGVWSAKHAKNSWIQIIEENDGPDAGNFIKYSYSFYWAIVTLFTTGYGDISAKNVYEQWTCCFAILIGGCFFAYFIGVLTNIRKDDHIQGSKKQTMEESLEFCRHHDLPNELTRAITTHIGYYNRYNYPFDHDQIMDSLPCYLQKEVQAFLPFSEHR